MPTPEGSAMWAWPRTMRCRASARAPWRSTPPGGGFVPPRAGQVRAIAAAAAFDADLGVRVRAALGVLTSVGYLAALFGVAQMAWPRAAAALARRQGLKAVMRSTLRVAVDAFGGC